MDNRSEIPAMKRLTWGNNMTATTKQNDHIANGSAKSLTTIAFDQIRNDILLCRLAPDQRLRITGLAERYAVGPTAIREALSRLVTDGLVVSEDQRGFCVAPVSRAELLDLTQTRIDIETLALGKAIALGDWESHVIRNFHRLTKSPSPTDQGGELHERWVIVHRQFHESLVAGCKSPWLTRLTQLLYDKSERYRNMAEFKPASNMRDTVKEHQELMNAIMGRDFELGKKLISLHFWETTNIILETDFATPRLRKAANSKLSA